MKYYTNEVFTIDPELRTPYHRRMRTYANTLRDAQKEAEQRQVGDLTTVTIEDEDRKTIVYKMPGQKWAIYEGKHINAQH